MATTSLPYGPSLSLAQARQAVDAAEAEAAKNGWNVVIAVVDAGGHLMYLRRMDHAQFGSIPVAEAKAVSAVAFKRPTKVFEDSLRDTPRILAIPAATPIDGGFPIVVSGKIAGGIGAAGAVPPQDAQVAKAGADALASLA